MNRRYTISLAVIVILLAAVIWIDLPNNPGISIGSFYRSLETVLGLDLRGGVQALLEVDLPADSTVDPQNLEDARRILENRTNALGVSENMFQVAGERRIVAEFPGMSDPEKVIPIIKETGQLEFVDLGATQLPEGTVVSTDFGQSTAATEATATPEATPTTDPAAAEATPAADATPEAAATVYHTIMTGTDLKSVTVSTDEVGKYQINFELSDEGRQIFKDYTTNNVGKFLAIVLDKKIISAPQIQTVIGDGAGRITGSYTYDSANSLAIQMRYGALPLPFKVVESRVIGPTLGQDSLEKSLIAGAVGFIIIMLFMGIYYRVPGLVADLALIVYALVSLALFKLIPVTLTLPGIAGFLLSTGSALDANILIFERLKEELRSGRTFMQALDLAWKRAWPSIRDSNISTIITCVILFWFGSSFGATIVKGFAFTLIIGVIVSMFTAIVVTRTFLHTVIAIFKPTNQHLKWFGLVD